MRFYCDLHDEGIGIDSWILTEEAMRKYNPYDMFEGWLPTVRGYVSDLADFLRAHKKCKIVVNDAHGVQVWPENIVEQEMSVAQRAYHLGWTSKTAAELRGGILVGSMLSKLRADRFLTLWSRYGTCI
jgi:hypothetical protein